MVDAVRNILVSVGITESAGDRDDSALIDTWRALQSGGAAAKGNTVSAKKVAAAVAQGYAVETANRSQLGVEALKLDLEGCAQRNLHNLL